MTNSHRINSNLLTKTRNFVLLAASTCSVATPSLAQEAADETAEHRQVRRLDELSAELLRLEGDLTFHTTQEHYYADGEGNEDAAAIEETMRGWCLDAESGSFPTFLDGLAAMQEFTNGAKTNALFRTREVTRLGERTIERTTFGPPLVPYDVTHVFEGSLKVSFRTDRGHMIIERDGKPALNRVRGPSLIFERETRDDDSSPWRRRMLWDAYTDASGSLDVLRARAPSGYQRTLVFTRDATFPFLVFTITPDRELAADEDISLDHAFVAIYMYHVAGSSRRGRGDSRELPYSDVLEFNYSALSPRANIRRTIINRSRVFEGSNDPPLPRIRIARDEVRQLMIDEDYFGGRLRRRLQFDPEQLPADVIKLLDIR